MERDALHVALRDLDCQAIVYLCIQRRVAVRRLGASLEFALEECVDCCCPALRADLEVVSLVWERLVAPFAFLDWALSQFLEFLYQEPGRVVGHQIVILFFIVANVFAWTSVNMLRILRGLTRFISKLA